jgi:hypothetical protein
MAKFKPAEVWTKLVSFLQRAKLFADVLGPVALVFFAYQADRIYHQVAATQSLQADVQKHQAEIQAR